MAPSLLTLSVFFQKQTSNSVFQDSPLQCCCCLAAQLCPTLCDPMGCSPPGSSVHGISQARILEWVAIPFSRGSCHQGMELIPPALAGFFTTEPPGKLSAVSRAHLGFLLPSRHTALAFTSQLSFATHPHSELTQDPKLLS